MSSLSPEGIARKHRKDLARLRGDGRKTLVKVVLLAIVAAIAGLVVLVNQTDQARDERSLASARSSLARSGAAWSERFIAAQQSYDRWLYDHGTSTEARIFDKLSSLLFSSASKLAGPDADDSFLERTYVSLHFAVMRLSFVLIACWRIWLLSIIGAFVLVHYKQKVYRQDDLLGQTGNGRFFYSGIRASLDNVSDKGMPKDQVVGLACLAAASPAELKTSALGAALERLGVANETNRSLAAVIVKHQGYPAYVADKESQSQLDACFMGANLAEMTLLILETAMAKHAAFLNGQEAGVMTEPQPEAAPESNTEQSKITPEQYAQKLSDVLDRVLSAEMKVALGQIPASNLATIVLAFEAGKVMGYAFEAGRWQRKSGFTQLYARSVLHSMPSYSRDYDVGAREVIRRALIFGSRKSVFAPVHMPLNLSASTKAARQWVECLMACPHELSSAANEVELFGIVGEEHGRFSKAFMEGVHSGDPEVVSGAFSTPYNLFVMPLISILRVLRKTVAPETIRRLETLITLVSQNQKLVNLSSSIKEENPDKPPVGYQERPLTPISFQEMKDLSKLHEVPVEDLRDWSALRIIPNSYGWLARRVGDLSVPESSVIFGVMKLDAPSSDANELGLIGRKGMVAFRSTRLQNRWGKNWMMRFRACASVQMAETQEDFEKLLRGVQTEEADEVNSGGAVA